MAQRPFEFPDLVAIRDALEELRQRLLADTSPDQRRIDDLAYLWSQVNERLAERQ